MVNTFKEHIYKHRNTIIAFLLCIVALTLALLLHPIYETNDDQTMESLLYGVNCSSGTSYLVFINRILGLILYSLISVFPSINWYFVMHYGTCLISLFVLIYVFNSKFGNVGLLVGLIVMAVVFETLILVQFTKTAAFASIAGGIGLIFSLKHKQSCLLTFTSIWLLIIASMIRMNALLSTGPFLLIVCFFEILEMRKNNIITIKKIIFILLIPVISIVLCYAISNIINANTPGNNEFMQYNHYRSMIQDYDLNQEALDSADSEVFMVANWMNNDPNVFTPTKLESLSNSYSATQSIPDLHVFFTNYINHIFDMILNQHMLIASLLVAVIVLIFGSSNKLYPFILISCFLFLEAYLVYSGRYNIHRVDYAILVALFISILYLCNIRIPILTKVRKEISGIILILLCITSIVYLGIPSLSVYSGIKFGFLSLHSSFKDACYDENAFYFIHPLAYDVDTERNIYDIPDRALQNDYCFMGGWGNGILIPGQNSKEYSETSMWEQCIDNDNIKLVLPSYASSFYIIDIEWYIKEHYNSDVKGILEYENEYISVYRITSL